MKRGQGVAVFFANPFGPEEEGSRRNGIMRFGKGAVNNVGRQQKQVACTHLVEGPVDKERSGTTVNIDDLVLIVHMIRHLVLRFLRVLVHQTKREPLA